MREKVAAAPKIAIKPHGALFEITSDKGENKGFLYGTMHKIRKIHLKLTPVIQESFNSCNALYGELDASDPREEEESQSAVEQLVKNLVVTFNNLSSKEQNALISTKVEEFRKLLPKDKFNDIMAILDSKFGSIAKFMTLFQFHMQLSEKGPHGDYSGLEETLFEQAAQNRLKFGGLLEMDSELEGLKTTSFLEMFKRPLTAEIEEHETLERLWLSGNLEGINKLIKEMMPPEEYKTTIEDRDALMAKKMALIMAKSGEELSFFAVGFCNRDSPS